MYLLSSTPGDNAESNKDQDIINSLVGVLDGNRDQFKDDDEQVPEIGQVLRPGLPTVAKEDALHGNDVEGRLGSVHIDARSVGG